MTTIVNTGSTLTVQNATGLNIVLDSTVAAGGLLDGSGTIVGAFMLAAVGTIAADVSGRVLDLDAKFLTNAGTIMANDALLRIEAGVTAMDFSGTNLTGGVWDAVGSGSIAFLPGEIVTDGATIRLDGPAATFDGFDATHGTLQPIDNSLVTISQSGALDLLNGRDFQAAGSLVVNGILTLGGGTLEAPTNGLTIGATGDLIGSGVIDPGTVVNDMGTIEASGGTLTVPQAGNVGSGGVLRADAGATLVLQAFAGQYAQTIINNGTIGAAFDLTSGTLDIAGAYSGGGGFLIQGGANGTGRTVLELPASVSANVAFDPNDGELLLDAAPSFQGTISGFGDSDRLILSGVSNAAHATLVGDDLLLTDAGGVVVVQTLAIDASSMNYANANFSVVENLTNSQATVNVQAACYAAGTHIATASGQVAVERLTIGDVVRARFAGAAPIVWIGRRSIDCRRHPEPLSVWPVRIEADAFGPAIPARDLLLSPDHAVYVEGVLIPVKYLINGTTIARLPVDQVTYFHVELAEHDVLLAEGLEAESWLDCGGRDVFENAAGPIVLHPDLDARRWEALGCAPLVVTGAKRDAAAARLAARADRRVVMRRVA